MAEDIMHRRNLSLATRRPLAQRRGPVSVGHTASDVKAAGGDTQETWHLGTTTLSSGDLRRRACWRSAIGAASAWLVRATC